MLKAVTQYWVPFTLLLASASVSAAGAADYGVGFSLSVDHATASIFFANGSIIDVAKIQGGPAYRRMMREPIARSPQAESIPPSSLDSPNPLLSATQSILVQRRDLCSRLPDWLCKDPATPASLAFAGMFRALKTSTEPFLEDSGEPLTSAKITLPFSLNRAAYDIVKTAGKSVGLDLSWSWYDPAGILVASDRIPYSDCGDPYSDPRGWPEAQMVLTVDYSDAALISTLAFEECNVFEERRTLQSLHLGAAKPNSHREEDLANHFREITRLPLKDGGNGAYIRTISQVVVLGERGCDAWMQNVLKDVLREHYDVEVRAFQTTSDDVEAACERGGDALFAAARVAARHAGPWSRDDGEDASEGYRQSQPPVIEL